MKITKKNLKNIELYYHPKQKENGIEGNDLYQHFKDENLLEDCLTLENLEEIQVLGLKEYNKYFKDKYVFAWQGVQDGYVPYLCEHGGEVVLSWDRLGRDWDANDPALRRKSSVLESKTSSDTQPLDLPDITARLERIENLLLKHFTN